MLGRRRFAVRPHAFAPCKQACGRCWYGDSRVLVQQSKGQAMNHLSRGEYLWRVAAGIAIGVLILGLALLVLRAASILLYS